MKTRTVLRSTYPLCALLYLFLSAAAFGQTSIPDPPEDDYEFESGGPGGCSSCAGDDEDDDSSESDDGVKGEGEDGEGEGEGGCSLPASSGGSGGGPPKLPSEPGPCGMGWDPSPTYRTRFKNETDYPAGPGQLQGNNWFTKMPRLTYDSASNEYRARFGAGKFRVYDETSPDSGVWKGRFGNDLSTLVPGANDYTLYDAGGKTYTFDSQGDISKIRGVGGCEVTFDRTTYSDAIIVYLKPDDQPGTEVRKLTYLLGQSSGSEYDRVDFIQIEKKEGANWIHYRTIDFTYDDAGANYPEAQGGDLIEIEDRQLLPSGNWSNRTWVFKYYVGSYDATANPGQSFQMRTVIGPESYRRFVADHPTEDIHTWVTDDPDPEKEDLTSPTNYVDRTYSYYADKRVKEIDERGSCDCAGGDGLRTFSWAINGTDPSDMNTWKRQMTVTLPDGSKEIYDFNKYGRVLNHVVQEVATDPNSRRWIRTWRFNSSGGLNRSYSVEACVSYDDATHTVTTTDSGGRQHYWSINNTHNYVYAEYLRDPDTASWKKVVTRGMTAITDGNRRRLVTSYERVHPTGSSTVYDETTFTYEYHASDPLAIMYRKTTRPVITGGENGAGVAVEVKEYFDLQGRRTWLRDGDGYIHYFEYDDSGRMTKRVEDIDPQNLPPGVPVPPSPSSDPGAFTDPLPTWSPEPRGLALETTWEYDTSGRKIKQIDPPIEAWDGSTLSTVSRTRQWHYTKLSGGERVTIAYPHLDSAYFHAALRLTVYDPEGHVVTTALGELSGAYQDTDLLNDLDETQATLEAAFQGTIVRRTDFVYEGDRLKEEKRWIDADGLDLDSNKYITRYTYTPSGDRETVTNASGTIIRRSYDVLGRVRSEKVGTVDGGLEDNMVLVAEYFYDDEEDDPANVGDGNLTRQQSHTNVAGENARITDYGYDHWGRLVFEVDPLGLSTHYTYDVLGRTTVVEVKNQSGVLQGKSENLYDPSGQVYESRTYGVTATGVVTGYGSARYWRSGRSRVVKTLSNGNVLEKTRFDGAGRVVKDAVSYDTGETLYEDAFTLANDTVLEEARFTRDAVGQPTLVGRYARTGSGTGPLTLANARPQYEATWYDPLYRPRHRADFGTNGFTEMTERPAGDPPAQSSSTSLVAKATYTPESEVFETTDPEGIVARRLYDDSGRLTSVIENFQDGAPGPGDDEDRTREFTYNGLDQVVTITAKASTGDQVTQNVYGVEDGVLNSTVSSNDLVKLVKYPDPDTGGAPSEDPDDQKVYGYNALGELVWYRQPGDPQAAGHTEHTLVYDARGALVHDRVTDFATGIDTAIGRISRTYDILGRPLKVTSYDDPVVGQGTVKNEVEYEYDLYSTVAKVYQEWQGAVNKPSSRKVEHAYSFPTDGTTALRKTSTTYTDGTVISDVYNAGTDDTISRLSGRSHGGSMLFEETYIGLGRLEKRTYGTTSIYRSVTLDRFNRVDNLSVYDQGVGQYPNIFDYEYNHNSQVTLRNERLTTLFDEAYAYDDLGRLVDHKRGEYYDAGGYFTTLDLHECWDLDRSGNPENYYDGSDWSCGSTWTGTFNASNEFEPWSYDTVDYNDRGDMTGKGGYNFTYDAWGRLVKADWGGILLGSYVYNGLHQKIYRGDLSVAAYYYYSGDRVVEEISPTGTTLQNYVWGTQHIDDLVLRDVSDPEFMVQDILGSVITRLDSSGGIVSRYVYDAYGMPSQLSQDWVNWETISEDLYLFTGRQWHRNEGLYDYRNRFMDPELGRFLNRDPLGLWEDNRSYGNGYLYVGGDPTNSVDPAGLFTCKVNDKGTKPCDADWPDDPCEFVKEKAKEAAKKARELGDKACSQTRMETVPHVTMGKYVTHTIGTKRERRPRGKVRECAKWHKIADALEEMEKGEDDYEVIICKCSTYPPNDPDECDEMCNPTKKGGAQYGKSRGSLFFQETIWICCEAFRRNVVGGILTHEISHLVAHTRDPEEGRPLVDDANAVKYDMRMRAALGEGGRPGAGGAK